MSPRVAAARRPAVAIAGVLLMLVPHVVGTRLPVYSHALVYVLLFLSLSLLVRLSGQVSLCHAAFAAVGAAQGLPVRALDAPMRDLLRAQGVRTADHFLGDADLRPCWTPERLASALAALEDGTTELMCHPGYAPSHARTSFGRQREVELRALCDARAREAIARAGGVLATFRDR